MTDAERSDAILAALTDLLAEVRALRADLAPKPVSTYQKPWDASATSWQCATCGGWIAYGHDHSCPGWRWASTTGGQNMAHT